MLYAPICQNKQCRDVENKWKPVDLQFYGRIIHCVADDVTDSENAKEKEKQYIMFLDYLKRIVVEDREICTKAEEQYGLWDKGIVIWD